MMPSRPTKAQPDKPLETSRPRDGANSTDTSKGISKAVGPPARAWKLLQVRVSPEVWEWTHWAAVLKRSNPGEVVQKAIHRLARSESQNWPEEDLPKLGRFRRRHTLVYEPFTKRVVRRRRRQA